MRKLNRVLDFGLDFVFDRRNVCGQLREVPFKPALREHNRIAAELAAAYPDWDDERLFQTTRNVMIVLLLELVIEEYIKHIGAFEFPLTIPDFMADEAAWNRPGWIPIEFDLLYRWHSMVPDTFELGAARRVEPA